MIALSAAAAHLELDERLAGLLTDEALWAQAPRIANVVAWELARTPPGARLTAAGLANDICNQLGTDAALAAIPDESPLSWLKYASTPARVEAMMTVNRCLLGAPFVYGSASL